MNPDQLYEQAVMCIRTMFNDCEFHSKYTSFCYLFQSMATMIEVLTSIARENFKNDNWQPPPPVLELVKGDKDN